MATQAPYSGDDERSGVLVVVDHAQGAQLDGQREPSGSFGTDVEVVVQRDGDVGVGLPGGESLAARLVGRF